MCKEIKVMPSNVKKGEPGLQACETAAGLTLDENICGRIALSLYFARSLKVIAITGSSCSNVFFMEILKTIN